MDKAYPSWMGRGKWLKAALLAKQDFVGPRTVFEGTHGFFKAFADPSIAQDMSLLMTWGNHWSMDKIAFKPFACGTMTQPFIDCAIAARQQIALDDIVSITKVFEKSIDMLESEKRKFIKNNEELLINTFNQKMIIDKLTKILIE